MLKKKKNFYIVCSIDCVLSMKKIKEKAFVIKKHNKRDLKKNSSIYNTHLC